MWYQSSHLHFDHKANKLISKMSNYSFNRRADKMWRVHCYVRSFVFITRVCVTAVLFPQHSDYVSLSPIALSVCLKAKLKNRCHWTVGECSSHAFLLRLYIPTLSTNGRPEEQQDLVWVPNPCCISFLSHTRIHQTLKEHAHVDADIQPLHSDEQMWTYTYRYFPTHTHTHTQIQYVYTVRMYANTMQNRHTAAP